MNTFASYSPPRDFSRRAGPVGQTEPNPTTNLRKVKKLRVDIYPQRNIIISSGWESATHVINALKCMTLC